eukprot:NODE_3246_length_1003_cov_18.817352_g3100_i0.p1 GENE.NODE_3246_length_1003_cov_18.817352_g3100_i0~~NODE_3246_length_1003_cov_18.817352_g3100_i0.p1  ORF type:complete len:279 (+),score=70.89 NODE_3246_length_1003_cov_18.817352_g3100_i0:31-837(+)
MKRPRDDASPEAEMQPPPKQAKTGLKRVRIQTTEEAVEPPAPRKKRRANREQQRKEELANLKKRMQIKQPRPPPPAPVRDPEQLPPGACAMCGLPGHPMNECINTKRCAVLLDCPKSVSNDTLLKQHRSLVGVHRPRDKTRAERFLVYRTIELLEHALRKKTLLVKGQACPLRSAPEWMFQSCHICFKPGHHKTDCPQRTLSVRVAALPPTATKQDVLAQFTNAVAYVKGHRKYGFVAFTTAEDASTALAQGTVVVKGKTCALKSALW